LKSDSFDPFDAGGCWWMLVDAGGCWWMLVDAGGCWWMLVDAGRRLGLPDIGAGASRETLWLQRLQLAPAP
jgi:hypothetical protein